MQGKFLIKKKNNLFSLVFEGILFKNATETNLFTYIPDKWDCSTVSDFLSHSPRQGEGVLYNYYLGYNSIVLFCQTLSADNPAPYRGATIKDFTMKVKCIKIKEETEVICEDLQAILTEKHRSVSKIHHRHSLCLLYFQDKQSSWREGVDFWLF